MPHQLFDKTDFIIDPEQCFLIMPFLPELRNVYDYIQEIVENHCGLKCIRPDKISGSNRITNDIWRDISESKFVIADLTGRNPNVFYETGIAHALRKPVVLITQNPEEDIPFDIREIRYLQYAPDSLADIKGRLIEFIKSALITIPTKWNPKYMPNGWTGSYVKITSVDAPNTVSVNQPFDITVTARNNGADAKQGYFSVSFPSNGERIEIIETNATKNLGVKGTSWAGGREILKYPIAEGYTYSDEGSSWQSGKEFSIRVRAYSSRKGIFRYYVSASSQDFSSGNWNHDPHGNEFDLDQRNEHVYTGVIDVV